MTAWKECLLIRAEIGNMHFSMCMEVRSDSEKLDKVMCTNNGTKSGESTNNILQTCYANDPHLEHSKREFASFSFIFSAFHVITTIAASLETIAFLETFNDTMISLFRLIFRNLHENDWEIDSH
uniref:Uncharacterized protein n=1 Tax=Glossina pallidipes TaxID=7398 RepID=A0A1B0A3B3_GLOPL